MKVMSINAGSSTLKFCLFNMNSKEEIISGNFERIGIEGAFYTLKYKGEKIKEECALNDHKDAVKLLLDRLISLEVIENLEEIDGIGHRVVHGGDKYSGSVIITDKVIEDITECSELAPLHNPAHLLGINAIREVLPKVPMIAVFDTAFHQTMEKERFLYPVPYSWYTDYSVRKYGFHGTSHRYIALTVADKIEKDLKIISCHIGSGASICAIKNGKSIDTSMGFTPLAGVMMGTRCGDIDPSIIPFVMEKEGKSAGEILDDLNKKSGLYGVSQFSSDSRDIEDGFKEGKEQCILAQGMFVNAIVKYISQYYVELGGADIITFTAGMGERSIQTRREVIEKLACLGIKLDLEANNVKAEFKKISTNDSSVDVYIVPTNEELMIAMDTEEIIK